MGALRTPFVWVDNTVVIDAALTRHIWERLGISPGLFHAWVELTHPPGSLSRAILVLRAYDNAYGTDHSRDIIFTVDLPDFAWEDDYLV